jgi:hypothetical protein
MARSLGEQVFSLLEDRRGLAAVHERLVRPIEWRRVVAFDEAAGVRRVPVEGWEPESPFLRARKALMPPLPRSARLVTAADAVVLSTNATRPRRLEIELRLIAFGVRHVESVGVLTTIDGRVWSSWPLSAREPARVESIELPPGAHTLRVRLARESEEAIVAATVREPGGAGADGSDGKAIGEDIVREYVVARQDEPAVLRVEAPTWLRIDRLDEAGVATEYRLARPGEERLELVPPPGRSEASFRVFERVERSAAGEPPAPEAPPPVDVDHELPERWQPWAPAIDEAAIDWPEEIARGSLRLHTWTFFGGLARRRAIEEDDQGRLKPDEHAELRATHRWRHATELLYLRTDLWTRLRASKGPGAGIGERVSYRPRGHEPLEIDAEVAFFSQWPLADGVGFSGPMEWSVSGSAAVAHSQRIAERWSNKARAALFGRLLSVDLSDPIRFSVTDQDVFTTYRSQHRHGLVLGDTITYRPWVDAKLAATLALSTNEDFDIFDPDNLRLRLGWTQRYRGLEVEAQVLVRQFFADGDRNSGYRRHAVGIEASHEIWLARGSRLELLGSYSFDIDRSDSSFLLGVAWHFGGPGGYDNFAPSELDFRALRTRNMEASVYR